EWIAIGAATAALLWLRIKLPPSEFPRPIQVLPFALYYYLVILKNYFSGKFDMAGGFPACLFVSSHFSMHHRTGSNRLSQMPPYLYSLSHKSLCQYVAILGL